MVYELDDRKTWKDEKTWMQANPGLGTIKKTDALRDKVNKAKANTKLVKNLLTKDFDIPETTSEAWLTFETLDNLSLIHISEPTRREWLSRMPSSA